MIKMWGEFDMSEFPIVWVKLGKNLNDQDWDQFKKDWLECYEDGREFAMIFDTSNVGWVNPKYAFRMASFIDELRRTEINNGKQLLRQSFIQCDSAYVRMLLKMIFAINKPVAPVSILPVEELSVQLQKFLDEEMVVGQ